MHAVPDSLPRHLGPCEAGGPAAEGLAQSTAIYEFDHYNANSEIDGKIYELRTHLHEADRVTGEDCAPAAGVYPDSGGILGVISVSSDDAGLVFSSWEEAEAFAETDEFETVEAVIGSARITL